MAFSYAFSVSSASFIAANSITQFSKTKLLITNISRPFSAQIWNINQHHTLVTPSKHHGFLSRHQSFSAEFQMKHAQQLEEVRQAFSLVREDPVEELVIIDAIQRLGIDYHFQEEIKAVLQRQYTECVGHKIQDHNIYEVALRFRLLRQKSYDVSPDVFKNFKDKEGKFKQNLSEDIKGLMSLYEASQLSMEGEDILDEAEDFSYKLLTESVNNFNHPEASLVRNTLRHPFHKNLARFTAKNFLTNFQSTDAQWRHDVQQLAMMDFNMLQSIHQKEIHQISQWWSDLGLGKEFKLIRDQPLKWYMWPMAIIADPDLSELRVELTKPISLIYVIDDIFDIYGTLDELTLFTEAVNGWDFTIVERLPNYMQVCFKALNDITTEIAQKVYRDHGWNSLYSLRKTWASLCNAFLVEAEWFESGHLPKPEEYLKNGVVSSGVHVLLVHMFFLLGQGITKENVDLMHEDNALIIHSTATILRLWDDLGSAKDENQDGRDGSYVKCYMKENQGSSVEIARKQVYQMILDSWKLLNQETLSPNPFSAAFITGSLNFARMVPLMYNYDDNNCLPGLEQHMKSLLHESFSL